MSSISSNLYKGNRPITFHVSLSYFEEISSLINGTYEVIREGNMEKTETRKEISIELLIVERERHQCLWNVTSEQYKN